MPTYEYECRKCGHRFEKFQTMSAKPVKTCPKCRGKVKRLFGTGAGIIFKGSGFYETDYKRKSGTAGGGGETESKSSASSTDTKVKTTSVKE